MSSTSQPDQVSARKAALHAAARCYRPGREQAILRRHPQADTLVAHASAAASDELGDVLITDLDLDCGELRVPAWIDALPRDHDFRRWYRRRLAHRWALCRTVAEHLPGYWKRLIRMSAANAREVCLRLGIEMIARCVGPDEPHEVIKQLAPLGTATARRVADRLADAWGDAPEAAIARRWRSQYRRLSRRHRRERIAAAMGLGLMADLLDQLSGESRQALRDLCRSRLVDVLLRQDRAKFLPVEADAVAVAESLVTKVVCTNGDARGQSVTETV